MLVSEAPLYSGASQLGISTPDASANLLDFPDKFSPEMLINQKNPQNHVPKNPCFSPLITGFSVISCPEGHREKEERDKLTCFAV